MSAGAQAQYSAIAAIAEPLLVPEGKSVSMWIDEVESAVHAYRKRKEEEAAKHQAKQQAKQSTLLAEIKSSIPFWSYFSTLPNTAGEGAGAQTAGKKKWDYKHDPGLLVGSWLRLWLWLWF